MDYAIAVIDIGMTNKKVAIYDENLHQLEAVSEVFEPLSIADPVHKQPLDIHDLEGMKTWFCDRLAIFAKKYPIKALSITTHGSTFVCIDKNGDVCAPCVFYTHDPGNDFQKEFYKRFGSKNELQQRTHTAAFGAMINPAKGIIFLQKIFPNEFAKTDCILYYPQYWNYVFTGVKGIEPTYCGCHTYLWNYEENTWGYVADELGIRALLPTNYKNSYEIVGNVTKAMSEKTGLDSSVVVTMGMHDSNASLLPHIAKNSENDFVLNSTGSWCVSMHPQKNFDFNEEDIGKMVFFNLSALCQPIKTSIFSGGLELDAYISLYKKINNTTEFPTFSFDTVNIVLEEKDTFLMPEIFADSGQFTGCKPGIWEKQTFYPLEDIQSGKAIPQIMKKEQRFCAILDLALVIQTETALKRAGLQNETYVFIEGGFQQNKLYNALLAAAIPDNPVFHTDIKDEAAFGAAMTANMAFSRKNLKELATLLNIEYVPTEKAPLKGYEDYKNIWIAYATT
ncbi:MAG: FGGY family carbohydrate kinase [Spirochaetales bacterium]